MVIKTSCISVCYQHQLRPFIECKIVVLRRSSIDFFEKVILKAPLQPNSNIQKIFRDFISGLVHTAGLCELILSFNDNRVQRLLTPNLEYLPLLLIKKVCMTAHHC